MKNDIYRILLRRRPAAALMLACIFSLIASGCGSSSVSRSTSAYGSSGVVSSSAPVSGEESASDSTEDAEENDFYSYFTQEEGQPSDPADDAEQLEALKSLGGDVFVWTAYWDLEGTARTISRNADLIDRVGIFAAWYPDGKNLSLDDNAIAAARHLSALDESDEISRYLTIVNDTDSEEKSISLLEGLISDADEAAKTADSIVQMAEKYDCSGIEIDFEKIRSDVQLWNKFIIFEEKMMKQCEEKGLRLRVLLEPSTPTDKIDLPEGPEYVVMCYNLYGIGTEPGPKADAVFLTEIAQKYEPLGNVSYALSNGGYDFSSTDKTVSVKPSKINTLISENNTAPIRDAGSGALRFTYGSHTVWYADADTLRYWAEILNKASGRTVDVSLWRLFGTGT